MTVFDRLVYIVTKLVVIFAEKVDRSSAAAFFCLIREFLRDFLSDTLKKFWCKFSVSLSFGKNYCVYVAKKQKEGDTRDTQEIAVEYNDKVIYPDKVRLNCYYYRNYSFIKDIQMILCTVLHMKMKYAGEVI